MNASFVVQGLGMIVGALLLGSALLCCCRTQRGVSVPAGPEAGVRRAGAGGPSSGAGGRGSARAAHGSAGVVAAGARPGC